MTKTIKELWYGNLRPIEYSERNNPEIKHLSILINCNYDKLEKKLNDNLKEMLEKYEECKNEYLDIIQEQAFCDGFCLGMKILAEAMIGAEKIT